MSQPHILLVDDAPDIGVIVRRFGRQAGQVVSVEPSAEAAWLFLQSARRPDLAILDVNLPGASGLELCQRIRAVPARDHFSIALFSHWQRPQDVAAGLAAGAGFLLSKDLLCQPDAWQRRVGEILRPPASRWPVFFLRWLDAPLPDQCRLARHLGPALATAAGNWLDAEVMRALANRAWQDTRPLAPPANDLDRLLTPDGLALAADHLVARFSPQDLPAFLRAFADQTWRLLGTADSAPFWNALATAAPPDCEIAPQP